MQQITHSCYCGLHILCDRSAQHHDILTSFTSWISCHWQWEIWTAFMSCTTRRRRRRRRSYQTKLKEFKLRPTDFAWFKSKQKLQGSEEDLKERSSNCSTPQSRGQIYKWRACRLPSGMKWNEMKFRIERRSFLQIEWNHWSFLDQRQKTLKNLKDSEWLQLVSQI
jgi:hypothetical protein